jgi:hypothetical protein
MSLKLLYQKIFVVEFFGKMMYICKGYPVSSTNPLSEVALRQPDCMSAVR